MMTSEEIHATFLTVVQMVLGKGSARGCRNAAAQSSNIKRRDERASATSPWKMPQIAKNSPALRPSECRNRRRQWSILGWVTWGVEGELDINA